VAAEWPRQCPGGRGHWPGHVASASLARVLRPGPPATVPPRRPLGRRRGRRPASRHGHCANFKSSYVTPGLSLMIADSHPTGGTSLRTARHRHGRRLSVTVTSWHASDSERITGMIALSRAHGSESSHAAGKLPKKYPGPGPSSPTEGRAAEFGIMPVGRVHVTSPVAAGSQSGPSARADPGPGHYVPVFSAGPGAAAASDSDSVRPRVSDAGARRGTPQRRPRQPTGRPFAASAEPQRHGRRRAPRPGERRIPSQVKLPTEAAAGPGRFSS
jgi:hypothetical protein